MRQRLLRTAAFALALVSQASSGTPAQPAVTYLDQGPGWTEARRLRFYSQDQGSELIPFAWLTALRQSDGTPFLSESLARYGYLPNPDPANTAHLPVGFTFAASARGPMVGMTCSACHVRQISMGGEAYRVDGGPAFAYFGAFIRDLDAAVRQVRTEPHAFDAFVTKVLGPDADGTQRAILQAEVELWSVRFHALVEGSFPHARPWGPTRLDAIAVIYNQLAGLDIGNEPTSIIQKNIQTGDAPVRFPFLWNAARQDFTQWTGVAENGNAPLALARSLSEIYGVFGRFHPQRAVLPLPLDHNYLGENSTFFAGLFALEGLLDHLGAPIWPGPLDSALAARGKIVFDRPIEAGGCAACHGETRGVPRPPVEETWRTPLVDVGSDVRAWQVLLRSVDTASLEGASVPGAVAPLQARDLSLNVLKLTVLGTIIDYQVFRAGLPASSSRPQAPMARTPSAAPAPKPIVNVYEARVLKGVWAAAPYLHNGSVPTLADLLKPAAERPTRFAIGPAYDKDAVGLAVQQAPSAFVLQTTGCEDRASGDSRCGHEYGTRLSPDDKKALLEYLKSL